MLYSMCLAMKLRQRTSKSVKRSLINNPAGIQCTALNAPTYGSVTFNTTVNSQAYYSCNPGFYLAGDTSRNCQCDGNWTGIQPTCELDHAKIAI